MAAATSSERPAASDQQRPAATSSDQQHRVVELQKFRRSQEKICPEHGRRDVTDDRYENEIGRFLL